MKNIERTEPTPEKLIFDEISDGLYVALDQVILPIGEQDGDKRRGRLDIGMITIPKGSRVQIQQRAPHSKAFVFGGGTEVILGRNCFNLEGGLAIKKIEDNRMPKVWPPVPGEQ